MIGLHAGIRIIEGPILAGVGPGDVIAVEEDHWCFLFSHEAQYRYQDGSVPTISSYRDAVSRAPAVRFHDSGWQRINHAGGVTQWKSIGRRIGKLGPWIIELVDDLPLIATSRRFFDVLAVRPTSIRETDLGLVSHWTSVHEDHGSVTLGEYFVVDGVDMWDQHTQTRPWTRGVDIEVLDPYVPRLDGGRIDPAIARTIVEQAGAALFAPIVCFDGVVRPLATVGRIGTGGDPHRLYSTLTGEEWADAPAAASIEDVAALVRGLRPDEWAIDQALLEECAQLLASRTRRGPLEAAPARGSRGELQR